MFLSFPVLYAELSLENAATHISANISLLQYLVNSGFYIVTVGLCAYAYILFRAHRKNPYFISSTKIAFILLMAFILGLIAWNTPEHQSSQNIQPVPTVKKTVPKIEQSKKTHWSKNVVQKSDS